MSEFGISFETFGWVMSAFYLTYALAQVPAGLWADRLNVYWLYAVAVAWWSAAGMGVALATTLPVLIGMRILLGLGESFNWPCALKVTSRILRPSDRSLGNGIFNSGAAIGAVITPLVVPILAIRLGWRAAFFWVGALGFLWFVAWLGLVRGPRAKSIAGGEDIGEPATSVVGDQGRTRGSAYITFLVLFVASCGTGYWGYTRFGPAAIWLGVALLMLGILFLARILPRSWLESTNWMRSLGDVVRIRRFWVLFVVTITINICWHYLVTWIPTYLKEDRSLTQLGNLVEQWLDRWRIEADSSYVASSLLTVFIFLMADLGNLAGGLASRSLARFNLRPARTRFIVMTTSALLISTGATVGWIADDFWTVVVLCIMAFGTAAFMANYFAFCQDVSPRSTGLVVGILGGIGNLFAAGVLPLAGRVKDQTGGFGPIFVLVGLAPFVGLLALATAWGFEEDAE
jgi:MFS family permease